MKLNRIIIIVTEKCNLRCTYCYVDKESGLTITDDVIEQLPIFLDKIINKYDLKYIGIDLFGGEAILEWSKICKIISTINSFKKSHPDIDIPIMTTTNLTLLNEEKLRFLKNNQVSLSLSLDGGRSSHNRCRVYPNGNGSYDDCLNGIREYCKIYHVPIEACDFKFMLSPDNIDYIMDGIHDYIKDGFQRINMSLVRDDIWDDGGLKKIENFYNEYVSFLIEKFYSTEPFIDTGLLLPYECRTFKKTFFCSAGSRTINIAPNGDIYPCQRFFNNRYDHTKMGTIFTNINETHNIANIYKNFSHDISPKCRNCELYGICYGQCFAAIMESGRKNICEPIDGVCSAIKIFYKASERYINTVGYENIKIKFGIRGER